MVTLSIVVPQAIGSFLCNNDEYEEEYLEVIPKELAIEPRFANGENKAAIQSQKAEKGKDDKCAEGDSLPLCYSSFELIRHRLKVSKWKHKLEDMVHSIDVCGTKDDKEEQSCSPSLLIDTSGICDEALGHKERGNSSQINSFFDFLPLGISSYREGLCLFDFVEERDDLHVEVYKEGEVLAPEVLKEREDVLFENIHGNPFQRYFIHQPDISPEEGHFRQLSHDEQRMKYAGGFCAFYDPISEYMEGLGNGNEWSHLYCKDQFICYSLLPFCISFLFIKHKKRTKLLGKLLDWLHWKSDLT